MENHSFPDEPRAGAFDEDERPTLTEPLSWPPRALDVAQRVLVVEDDPVVARAVGRCIERRFGAVTIARSCADAALLGDDYDCGVFDVSLPDGDGAYLALTMMQRGRVRKAVFFTAELSAERRGLHFLGDLVAKSDGMAALRSAVDRAVDGAVAS